MRSARAAFAPTDVVSFPAYLFQVKKPSESKYRWDYYQLLHTSPASEVLHPLNDKCKFPV